MIKSKLKQAAAQAAIDFILPRLKKDSIVGIGTGSTTNYFIKLLASHKNRFSGTVASSHASAEILRSLGVKVYNLSSISYLEFYVDGADECDISLNLVKGGGAALTGEKIIAAMSKVFICIIDSSKLVKKLGIFPVPLEVISMSRSYVCSEIIRLGGAPIHREGIITDYGNIIIDVKGLNISNPMRLEGRINDIVGVVTNGLFTKRKADLVFLGSDSGIKILKKTI